MPAIGIQVRYKGSNYARDSKVLQPEAGNLFPPRHILDKMPVGVISVRCHLEAEGRIRSLLRKLSTCNP